MKCGNKKQKPRRVSVMQIQRLPVHKVVKLFDDVIAGKTILISIYPNRTAHIGLRSPTLRKFTENLQGNRVSATTKMMRIFSKRWYDEDKERIHEKKECMDQKILQETAPPGFHSAKML